jgi:hypothetical protein
LQENPAGMMVVVDTLHPGDDYAYIDELWLLAEWHEVKMLVPSS